MNFGYLDCDCDWECNIEDSCVYTVDVTPLEATSEAIISNSSLSAIATCSTKCC